MIFSNHLELVTSSSNTQESKDCGGVGVGCEVPLPLTLPGGRCPKSNACAVPFLQENQKVKKDLLDLLEAQTNIAFLQSELDALKSDYADQTLNSERYET